MLPGMVKIDDLNGPGKVQIGLVPNPDSPIGDDDFDGGPFPTSAPGFGIDSVSELLGSSNGSHIGRGIRIVDPVDSRAGQLIQDKVCIRLRQWSGPSIFIHSGLCEHSAELALAGAGSLDRKSTR